MRQRPGLRQRRLHPRAEGPLLLQERRSVRQLANTCDPASVCLHHDCYVACDGDGGGCAPSDCKQVTVTAGTYAVCATATTLGSDCDFATGATCPGTAVCIDGYCK